MHLLSILLNSEGSAGARLPDVLLVIVVLTHHTNLVRDQVCRVETNTELSNHRDVASSSHGFHESLGARFGNSSKIVDELVLGHANPRVFDRDGGVGLVWYDLDEEVRLCLNLVRVCDGLVANLVQRIRSIGDDLSQEDLFVGIEGVDDQTHELLNVGIESKCLSHNAEAAPPTCCPWKSLLAEGPNLS